MKTLRKVRVEALETAEQPTKCSENSSPDVNIPPTYQNRVGRWTNSELASLKIAMSIFGDQSWKKIQRFLIQDNSQKTKQINKYEITYRSVKAIQSKIYQIKPELEQEQTTIQA